MREALREKGIEVPYQDPGLKYQANELASVDMYINNYADVRNPGLTPLLYTVHDILMKALTDCSLSLPPTNVLPRPPTMEPSALEHPPSPSRCCSTPALPTCGWTPSTVTLRPAVSTNQRATHSKISHSLPSIFECEELI